MTYLQENARCDLPDLVMTLLAAGKDVRGFRFDGYWLDIGRPEDYETAVAEYEKGTF